MTDTYNKREGGQFSGVFLGVNNHDVEHHRVAESLNCCEALQ